MSVALGNIIESKVEKKWEYRSAYQDRYDYHCKVTYEFKVDDKKYTSSRIAYWNTSYNSQKKAAKVLEKYSLGNTITVYYYANNPLKSFLEVEDDLLAEEEE